MQPAISVQGDAIVMHKSEACDHCRYLTKERVMNFRVSLCYYDTYP